MSELLASHWMALGAAIAERVPRWQQVRILIVELVPESAEGASALDSPRKPVPGALIGDGFGEVGHVLAADPRGQWIDTDQLQLVKVDRWLAAGAGADCPEHDLPSAPACTGAQTRSAACADVGQVAVKYGLSVSGSSRLLHTEGMIRLGTSADLAAATGVYRRASLSNAGYSDNLLAHPEYLILGPEGLAEGRTHVAEEDGSLVGFATWVETAGTIELEDLFVDPGYMRRGIAAALVECIADVLRARGVERLEVTVNPHALEFYRAVGFTDCGVAETEFGTAPRMLLAIA